MKTYTENICCNCRFYEGVKGVRGCAPCKENKKMKMWDDSCEKIWLITERLTVMKPVSPDRCVGVEGDSCHICEFIRKLKPITNADRIRAMGDEELAEFVAQQRFCTLGPIADKLGIDITQMLVKCRDIMLDWLRHEAEEG